MIFFSFPPHRTKYSGTPSDFRASTRSNRLLRYNTPDKNTRDRGGIGLNYGPWGSDESKIAERAIKSEDLPSYLGGALFQNGSACFRLHVRHSAGEAAEGGRERGGGCCGCHNPGMLLVSHREGDKRHMGAIRAPKAAPASFQLNRSSNRSTGFRCVRDRKRKLLSDYGILLVRLHGSSATLMFVQCD